LQTQWLKLNTFLPLEPQTVRTIRIFNSINILYVRASNQFVAIKFNAFTSEGYSNITRINKQFQDSLETPIANIFLIL